jgi:ATP-binding cassette subfamily B protein
MKKPLIKIFLDNIKKQKLGFMLLIVTSVFSAIQQCVTPWAIRYILNLCATVKYEQIGITRTVIAFLIIFLISEMIIRSQGFFVAIVLPKFKKNIKSQLIGSLLKKNYAYFLETMPGSLTQKVNDFASSSERMIQIVFYNFFPIFLSVLLAAVFLYSIEPFYSLSIITWFSIHILTTWYRLKKSLKVVQHHNKIHSYISGTLCELISRIAPIKIHLGEEYELKNLDTHLSSEKSALRKAQFFFEKVKIVQSLFSLIFIFALIVHQVHGFNNGYYSVGDFIFVAVVTFNLINYVWFSSFQLTIFARELGTIKEAYEVLSKGQDDPYALYSESPTIPIVEPNIRVKNLSYMFLSRIKAIEDLSLEIDFGEKVLMQGRSGIGKSTFAKLLVGLHTRFQGQITIGGREINQFSRTELNKLIILVEQNPLLFNRTIRENICYSNTEYSEADLNEVLKISCCHEFISALPKGLDTRLGEQGYSLSGGQIQRIAIARALLGKPKILILDESTSGLDKDLERKVLSNLVAFKNQTLIVITHSRDLHSIIPKTISFSSEQPYNKFYNEGALTC